jgi:hypothetical protein
MSVAYSLAALSNDGDPVNQGHEMGKAQKRRIGRSAISISSSTSISTSNNSHSGSARSSSVSQPSTLNPHAQLRLRLIDEGIEETEIDRALEEMWERELPYDDFNAVMSFIHSRNAVKEQSDSIQQCPPEEETKTASTSESTSTSTDERQGNDGVDKDMNTDETNSATDSTGYAENSEARQLSRQRKAPVHPINMSSKLDLVADYENLADAAFALSEWVAKAADREEVCCAIFLGFICVFVCVYRMRTPDTSPIYFLSPSRSKDIWRCMLV